MSNHKGKYKNDEIESLSSKLKFISKLQPGQKISVSTGAIQENTYWTSMARSLSGENRSKAYRFISDVIKDSLSILESLSNSSNEYDIQICRNLITDLICLKPGLDNLQSTYSIDKMYVSKIQTMIENLDVKIHEICDKREEINFEDLFEDAQEKMAQQLVEDYENHYDSAEEQREEEGEGEEENEEEEEANEEEVRDEQKKKNEVVEEVPTDNSEPIAKVAEVCQIQPPEIKFCQPGKVCELKVCQAIEHPATLEEPIGSESYDYNFPSIDQQPSSTDFSEYLKSLPSEDLLLMTTSEKVQPDDYKSGRAGRKKRKKHAYQYDTYYMSPPDDVTLCNSDLEKGIIR